MGGWVTCFLALLRGNASSLRSFLPLQMDLSSSFFIHSRRWFIDHLSNFSLIFSKQKKQCVSVWHPSTKTCNYFHHNGWKLCEGFESSRVFDFYLNLLFLLWGLNQMLLLFSSLSVGGEQAIGEGSLFQKLKKKKIWYCHVSLLYRSTSTWIAHGNHSLAFSLILNRIYRVSSSVLINFHQVNSL